MTRTLLLDLDGTLVDTVPDLAAALNRLMLSRSLPPFTIQQVTSMVGDGVAVLMQRAFAAHDVQPDAAAIKDFLADYESHVAVGSRVYPGVIDALSGLARQGWQLAVCTNKPEHPARMLLDVLGLLPLMRAVGGGDSFPMRKPDPGHVLATLALASGMVGRAVLLGDHRNDVLSANGAGLPCIFAGWGYGAANMAEGSAAVAQTIAEAACIANRLIPATD